MIGAFALYMSALGELVVGLVIVMACVLLVCAVFVPLVLEPRSSGRAMKTGGVAPPPPHSALFEGEVMGCRLGPDPLLQSDSGPARGGRSTRSAAGSARARTASRTTPRRSNSSANASGSNGSADVTIGAHLDVIS